VNQDYNAMSRVVQSLYRAFTNGNVRASQQTDLFLRCLKIFDARNADLHKVQVNDPVKAMAGVRDLLNRSVFNVITDKARATASPPRASRHVAHLEGL